MRCMRSAARRNLKRSVQLCSVAIAVMANVIKVQAAPMIPYPPVVQINNDQDGLISLRYNGIELLSDGVFGAQAVTLVDSDGKITEGSTTPTATSYDDALRRLLLTYSWGTIACRYLNVGDRLRITVAVTNTSKSVVQQITLHLLSLRFPQPPKGWVPNYQYVSSNTGDPPVIIADYGHEELAVCNDDVGGKPLLVGFPGRADFSDRPLVISTAGGWDLSPYLDKYIARPIAPGATDIYKVSLRIGPSGSPETAIAGDILTQFARIYPSTLTWSDHRPIGTIVLSQMESKAHSDTNPYGWFGDPSVDVVSDAGQKQFHDRLMKYAADSIKVLQTANAQGVVVWDLEGQHYPQPTSYIGDARLLPVLSPVMNVDADEFFASFRKAGFKVGVCIRPQQLTKQPDGGYSQVDLTANDQIENLLVDKILYANKRWGCTLFYCDSNGDPNVPFDPVIYEVVTAKIAALGIKALIMPEHANTRYYAYTAPYKELRLNVTQTPIRIKDVYPDAFSAIYIPDGPVDLNRDALVQGVKGGDILLFRGWWPDPDNVYINQLYLAAGRSAH